MDSRMLPCLVATLMCLFHELPEGFTFLASWDGFKTRATTRVSQDELGKLAAQGELAAHVRYIVGASDA